MQVPLKFNGMRVVASKEFIVIVVQLFSFSF